MNLKEAYATLELAPGTSQEDAKKRYRELSKKWHPDINKDPGAEDKFKKINEAYQIVQSGKDPGQAFQRNENYSPFYRQTVIKEVEDVRLYLNISFKESVLGCKKEVQYSRHVKCNKCDGKGDYQLNNGCKKCGGQGRTVTKQGASVLITTCGECHGRSDIQECDVCSGSGSLHTDVSVHVSVPAGITNGTILRLQGMGNYIGSFMGFVDQHADAFCHVSVSPEDGLTLDGKNVVSHLDISLLDALKGCQRMVKTIYGNKEINIKAGSRNAEEVIIPHCGVSGIGNQRVVLDVKYPQDTDKLIKALLVTDEVI